jgi:hypothetical protein
MLKNGCATPTPPTPDYSDAIQSIDIYLLPLHGRVAVTLTVGLSATASRACRAKAQ